MPGQPPGIAREAHSPSSSSGGEWPFSFASGSAWPIDFISSFRLLTCVPLTAVLLVVGNGRNSQLGALAHQLVAAAHGVDELGGTGLAADRRRLRTLRHQLGRRNPLILPLNGLAKRCGRQIRVEVEAITGAAGGDVE